MRLLGASLMGATMLAGAAVAADIATKAIPYPTAAPPVSVWSWSGIYLGVNVGYGWGHSDVDIDATDPTSRRVLRTAERFRIPTELTPNPHGFLGGATAGYNYQFGPAVLGVETDLDWAGLRDDDNFAGALRFGRFQIPVSVMTHDQLNWLGTTRLRVGFAPINPLLIYATGGVAYGGVESSAGVTIGTGARALNYATSNSETRIGWAAGAGLEYAFATNWTVRGEYLRYDLGESNWTFTAPNRAGTYSLSAKHEGDLFRTAVAYKF
jgi:outer membrane immunogenic protein